MANVNVAKEPEAMVSGSLVELMCAVLSEHTSIPYCQSI